MAAILAWLAAGGAATGVLLRLVLKLVRNRSSDVRKWTLLRGVFRGLSLHFYNKFEAWFLRQNPGCDDDAAKLRSKFLRELGLAPAARRKTLRAVERDVS